jgi:hypothetical protein
MNANLRTLLQGGGLKAQLLRGGAASSGLKTANVGHVLFGSGAPDIEPSGLQNPISSAPREYARSSILSVYGKHKRHVLRRAGADAAQDADGQWLDHVYRLVFDDATPCEGVSHHPILNQRIEFAKTAVAAFRKQLFNPLRRKRKFALRLIRRLTNTKPRDARTHPRHASEGWHPDPNQRGQRPPQSNRIAPRATTGRRGPCRSRSGAKGHVNTESKWRVDPLWQSVSDYLFEHVGGGITLFQKPGAATPPNGAQA